MSEDIAKGDHIDIVFDGPPGPVAGRFVEVTDIEGRSADVGSWIDRGDGFWALRICAPEMTLLTYLPRGDGLEEHLAEMFGDDESKVPAPPEMVAIFLKELGKRGFDIIPRAVGPVQ